MSSMPHDIKITGDWQRPPSDNTAHRLEFAPTSTLGVAAARSNTYPDQVLPLTREQILRAARDVEQGRLGQVFGT